MPFIVSTLIYATKIKTILGNVFLFITELNHSFVRFRYVTFYVEKERLRFVSASVKNGHRDLNRTQGLMKLKSSSSLMPHALAA